MLAQFYMCDVEWVWTLNHLNHRYPVSSGHCLLTSRQTDLKLRHVALWVVLCVKFYLDDLRLALAWEIIRRYGRKMNAGHVTYIIYKFIVCNMRTLTLVTSAQILY